MSRSIYAKLLAVALCLVLVFPPSAEAAHRTHRKRHGGGGSASVAPDARYADIIMNPVTGEVYHATNPDGLRYPASLTKMMTLYLLFEALEQHKTTLGAYMDVSAYAAGMPQTNLALHEGDSIPVEIAIKALVVRSANDVAVVVGEALGGDVDHFADMMTAKARALGMRNTVFQNPNGLPNSAQHTTARDMAKLGIALKRDFPRYYAYFATREFSWDGVTYYTHNRVMLRYSGTDGIKTGFIGASGFNLVTSVVRGGRPLVGSVMGGPTGAWRDNRMIALLDSTYKVIAKRGAERGKIFAENLPLPKNGGGKAGAGIKPEPVVEADNASADNAALPEDSAQLPPEHGEDDNDTAPAKAKLVKQAASTKVASASVKAAASPAAAAAASVKATNATSTGQPVNGNVSTAVSATATASGAATTVTSRSPFALVKQEAKATVTPQAAGNTAKDAVWGIQVGAFSSQKLAEEAMDQSVQIAKEPLASAKNAVAGPDHNGAPMYRARLTNLTERQAKDACKLLINNHSPCFIFKPGT